MTEVKTKNNFHYIVVDADGYRSISEEELVLNDNDLIQIKINSAIYEKYKEELKELTAKIRFEANNQN